MKILKVITLLSLILLVFVASYYFLVVKGKTLTSPPVITPQTCRVGGCNSELCLGGNDEDTASICIYEERFACYQDAKCEVQSNGTCGWTMDEALQTCLKEKSQPI